MSSKYQSAINKVNAIIENDKKQQAEQERMKNSRFASAYRKLGLLEDDTTDNTPVDESRRVNQIASNPKAELDRRESNKNVIELSSKTPLSAPNLSAFVRSRSPQTVETKTTNPKNVLGSQFDLSSPLNQLKTHAVSTGSSEDINKNEIPQLSNADRLKLLMDKSSDNTPAASNADRLKLLMDKSSENAPSSNENNGFFDRFVTDAKYIGEMGKVGLESGIDALKTTTKTFASSISDFLERLFPGKEVGNSGVKIPAIRQSTSPVMRSYAESQETGLQDVSTPIKSASSAFTAELTKNLDEYANTNTRQKKLEELQEKYSDDDIGTVTQFIADAANSIGYNLPAQLSNIFTSGLGGAMIMGTQSFSDAYSDARNSGATRQEALKYASQEAINQGALDTLFGAFGGSVIGDKLSAVGSAISSPAAKTAFEVGVNTVGEAAEEMLQSIVTTINQRTTYDKEATIDPSALAYEGLLGGTMGAFFGIASAPGKYKAYKTDYNLVNEFSKRASKVSTNEEADTVIKAGETLVKASDDIINNKGSSAEDVSRATYIKRGINESLDILSGYRDRIIIDNTAKNDIITDIIYQPMSRMNQNLARLADNIAESAEPGENAVNKTIDYIRDEIRFLRDNANSKQTSTIEKYALSDPEFRKNALIEIEKMLRQNREQIEAERNKLSDSQDIGTAEPAASSEPEIKTVPDKSNGTETTGQQESTAEVEENRNDPLTDKPVIDTIDAVEEKTSETPRSSENKHDFSLTYKQTKHTKSGDTLNVFATNGKLSKDEYASLKSKMKEIGGYWSGFVKGFIVPADKVDAVSEFADVTGENTNRTVGETETTVGETAPAVGESNPTGMEDTIHVANENDDVPVSAENPVEDNTQPTTETEAPAGTPTEPETEAAKEELHEVAQEKEAEPLSVTANARALESAILRNTISKDSVIYGRAVDGFSDEQRQYFVESLIDGVKTDSKTIHTDIPYDGTFDIKNTPYTVANILDALHVKVNVSEGKNVKKIVNLFKNADRLVRFKHNGETFITNGLVAVKITEKQLPEIDKELKKYNKWAEPKKNDVLSWLPGEKLQPLAGLPYKAYQVPNGKTVVLFEGDDGREVFADIDFVKFFDSKDNVWALAKMYRLSGASRDTVVSMDKSGNINGVIVSYYVPNTSNLSQSAYQSKSKLESNIRSAAENSEDSDTAVSESGSTEITEENSDTSERSDEHQALAEGVIPGISPQSTTESPVSDGMQTETAASDSLVNSFYGEIADRVLTDYLEAGKTLTINDLQQIATTIYKGTLSEGAFSPKDMTDALELAVNHYIIKFMSENNAQYNANDISSAEKGLQWAEWILDRIPTQTKRTEEQLSLQQFSTPPNIAYLANWAANINESDFMLEPSAGIGGLASFAKAFGATTAVNEISERRLGALRALGFDHVFSENAEQLDNILPDYVKPTVVVMNPPFSSTGGRTKNSSANAKPHVEQALYRLENGGRLVAILGQGMSNDAPMFSGWWDKLRENYNIRANIGIDGSNYRKYGTTFNVRLVIIDKTGPQTGETITGDFKSLNDIPKILEGVRNDRTHTGTTESNGIVESNEGASVRAGRISESERTVSDTVSGNNASAVGSGNAMGSGLSSARMGSIRSESDSIERVRSDAGMAVQGNDEQSGVRMGTSGNDGSISEMAQGAPGGRNNGRSLGGSGPSDGDIPGYIGQSGNGSVEELAGGDGGDGGRITTRKSPPKSQKKKANTSDDGIYAGYVPSKLSIKGAKPHPAVLVESSAMAAVAAPEITYVPNIAQDVIEKGLISDVQLENISYAGQAHEQMLENGTRKGYFIGDGTGVGKGRQAAGIILDNFNQGRRKALWISEKKTLMEDAKRDWSDIGGNPDDIFDIDGIRKGVGKGKNKKVPEEGILFVPYSTVKSKNPADKKTTNADPIIQWLGKDFDGVIIYDEAHNMNSLIPSSGARGTKTGAQQAIEANKIQESLPNARVVYMSATGATEVKDLCFASRLGLWGKGTQFMSAEDFSSKIGASGVAGMELVASSLKSMGVYQARSISFEGVRYDSVRHKLTKEQRQIYDTMSEAWQITLQNMEKAIQITGVKNIGNARGIFYKAMQNFYNQVLSSMATPSVIEDIKKELDAGHSCVVQLINTNASQQENELSKAKAEERDLEELDITPRGALLGFLENSFPVQQYEEYLDEHGNKKSRPVFDSKGNPVLNKQAVAARDALIERINEMSIPDGPIDMILNAFGTDNVAEVTGRSRRVVNKPDENGNIRKVEENLKPDFRIAETTAFQNGEKRILIFSNAGATGRSYHADKRAKNQQQRIHYILQPGWSAKTATQGFGRTHRSNQVIPPVYKLVQTDIEGQKRFVTSIARRLDQLGALTKGQRQTGSGIFGEKDNLESPLSRAALREFFKRLGNEQIDGINGRDVFTKLGLYRNFYDEYGNFTLKNDKSEDITTFLNRLLALKVDEQNIVFGEFETIRQQMYDAAIENGTLDTGISNVKADKITVNQENTIHTDEKTGSETKYVKATAYRKPVTINTVDDAIAMRGQFQGLRRMEDGSVRAVYRVADETDAMGRVHKKYLLQSPNRSIQSRYRENKLLATTTEIPKEEWDSAWSEELKSVPAYNESTLHIITGDILSVWNKLPQDGNIKAMKIVTDDGSQILGRIIPEDRIDAVLRGMDIKQKNENLTGQQIYDAIIKSGKEAVFSQSYSGKNTIKRSRVSGENRIEVTGSNLWSFKQTYPDIIVETIQYEKRYFIPTGEKGVKILDDIVSKNNVSLTTKNENSLFFSKSNGKWGSVEQNSEKIKSVSDLQREATRIFGVQINTGKIGKKGAAGVFNTHANTIRTRVYGDIPTIAHEIGHWFDKRYRMTDSPEIDEIIGIYQSDLEEAGYNESVFPNEAIAYYFADLMRNKQNAETIAPDFSAWLDDILSYSDKKRLSEYVDMCNAYHSADTMQRRGAQIRYRHKDHSTVGEARFQVDTFRRNPAAYLGNLSKRFVWAWVDDIADLIPFGKTYDLSMKERTANSIVSGRLNIAFTDNKGNVIGKSLSAILQEGGINDLNHNDFNAYLVARVALDRIEAAENGENVATLVYADTELQDKSNIIDAIQTYERNNPTFADTAKGVYEYRNNLLDIAVDAGIVSESLSDYFKKTFPHYVPLYRSMDKNAGISSGRGKKTPKAPIARFKGSGRDIYAPIENIAIQTAVFTKSILQNEVRTEFANFIDSHEDMGWAAEKTPESKIFDTVTTDEIGERLEKFDSDKLDSLDANEKTELFEELMSFIGDTTGMWKAATRQGENVISVLRNGKREYYEIHDEDLMKAMLTMTPQQYDVILNAIGSATSTFKILTTGSNPRYGFTNVPRDNITGYISSKTTNNPFKYVMDYISSFGEAIVESDGYKEFLRSGGGYQGALTMDMRNLKHQYSGLVKSHSKMKSFIQSAVGFIPRFIDAGESASRYAEFKRARQQGIDGLEALRMAQEVTVNFQRHGAIGKVIDKFIPYFNSGIQALYHYYEVLSSGTPDQKKARWIKFVSTSIVMAAITLAIKYIVAPAVFDKEDEPEKEYAKLSNYNKNAYWCFYAGNGEFIRIAKPKDMMVFSTLIERAVEYYADENPSAFYNFGNYLASAFFPPAFDDATIIGTVLSLAKNETFTGAPIVPSAYQNLSPELQYNEKTSALSIALGSLLNLSPMQIDFVIDDTTGFVGDFILNLTKSGGTSVKDVLDLNDRLVPNVLMADNVYSTDAVSIFYETKDKYDTNKASYKATSGENDKYTAYDVYGSYKYGKIAELYSTVNKMIKADTNEQSSRDTRSVLNDLIRSVNNTESTDIDKAVSELAERTGTEVSDIAPYIVVPTSLKDAQKNEYVLDAYDMMEYYTESQILFQVWYQKVLDSGYDDAVIADALASLKKEIKRQMDDRYLYKLRGK